MQAFAVVWVFEQRSEVYRIGGMFCKILNTRRCGNSDAKTIAPSPMCPSSLPSRPPSPLGHPTPSSVLRFSNSVYSRSSTRSPSSVLRSSNSVHTRSSTRSPSLVLLQLGTLQLVPRYRDYPSFKLTSFGCGRFWGGLARKSFSSSIKPLIRNTMKINLGAGFEARMRGTLRVDETAKLFRAIWLMCWKGLCPYQCEAPRLQYRSFIGCSQPAPRWIDAHTLSIHLIGYQPANAELEAVADCYTNRQQRCKPTHIWLV